MPIAELGVLRGRADLVVLLEETLRVAGVLGPEPVHSPALPLVARLLGYHANTLWQRGDLDTGERQARRALDVAAAAGEPSAGRDAEEALANVFGFRGDLATARRHGVLALELAIAAADPDAVAFALSDLALQAAYAGDHDASLRREGQLAELAVRTGSVTVRAWLMYTCGECRAERNDPQAARYLTEAVTLAEEAGLSFIAGIARHTLLTSAARTAADPAEALQSFGPLLDHWHGFGSWTQLWMAIRVLTETLSRLDRHRDVAVLIGATRGQPPRVAGVRVRLRASWCGRGRCACGVGSGVRVVPRPGGRARRRRGGQPRPQPHSLQPARPSLTDFRPPFRGW